MGPGPLTWIQPRAPVGPRVQSCDRGLGRESPWVKSSCFVQKRDHATSFVIGSMNPSNTQFLPGLSGRILRVDRLIRWAAGLKTWLETGSAVRFNDQEAG